MAGASNFMTDTMNVMGMQGLMNPNPYLEYTGQIPMAGYRGTPTDASGKPIQSFLDAQAAHDAWQPPAQPAQGTTLNSSQVSPGAGYFQKADPSLALGAQIAPQGSQPGTQAMYGRNFAAFAPTAGSPLTPGSIYGSAMSGGGGQQSAAAAPAPQNPIDMRQAYLDALSNPGKVTTPGAQMLPGTTPTGPSSQPSVLQQFLQQHPEGGQTGGGGYSNTGFFSTLNALKQGAGT